MTRIAFTLDLKPKAWQRATPFNGKAFTPIETRTFESWVRHLARPHAPKRPLDGPLELTARFYLPRPKKPKWELPAGRPDLDNLLKSLKDGLNKVIWSDDARVCRYGQSTGKYFDSPNGPGRIEIEVQEII